MSELGSVSQVLQGVKKGDEEAAKKLWDRMSPAVAARARNHLKRLHVRGADQDDIANDVFASICRGAANGRFTKLNDRKDLNQVLMMLTKQKAIDRARKRKRDWTESALGGREDDSAMWGLNAVEGDDLPPDLEVAAAELLCELLDDLDDERKQIVLLRMEGLPNREIGERLNIAETSVRRKLKLIRMRWESKFGDDKHQ